MKTHEQNKDLQKTSGVVNFYWQLAESEQRDDAKGPNV